MGQTASQSGSSFQQDREVFIPGVGDVNSSRQNGQKRFKHPIAAMFHVIFKFFAFFTYLFGGIFGQDFISTFVIVILFISMDFWVVKNVTGRLLVGLRWSNHIDEEGNSHWIFENKNQIRSQASSERLASSQQDTNDDDGSADSSIFWTGLIAASLMWALLMIVCIFRLNVQWLMLVTLASVLSTSNLYGYTRCRLGTSDIKSSVTQFVAKQMFYNFLTGGSSSNKPTA